MNGEDVTEAIRAPEVSSGASKVAVIPGVRRAMVAKQRAMGERASVVMEGRDIGTVVFPHAEVKIFLDARPGERVRRRFEEGRAKGETISEEALAAQIAERDRRDSTRAEAPLDAGARRGLSGFHRPEHRRSGRGHSAESCAPASPTERSSIEGSAGDEVRRHERGLGRADAGGRASGGR